MFRTYDDYLNRNTGTQYKAFERNFNSEDEAVEHALIKLAKQGDLVEINMSHVPDMTCHHCGELLFDFQTPQDMQVGEEGDDVDCYLSTSYGVICKECARKIALSEVEEVEEPEVVIMPKAV